MKVFYTLEILQVIKFIFDSPMDCLNIAVVAPGSNRDSFMLASKTFNSLLKSISGSVLPKAADKLFAVIGLELQLFHIDTALFKMTAKYLSKQTGVICGALIGKTQEHKPASYLPCGELILRQLVSFHLRPVVWYILQFLGIYRYLAKQLPFLLYLAEVSFSFVLFATFLDKTVFVETGQAFLPVAIEPFTNGLWCSIEELSGRLYTMLDGTFYYTQSQIVPFDFAQRLS